MWARRHCVWGLVCMFLVIGQVRSQEPADDLPIDFPSSVAEDVILEAANDPSPTSVAEEVILKGQNDPSRTSGAEAVLPARPDTPTRIYVNGPTGISVEEEHHRAAGVRDFVNGPTGTSIDAEEDRPPEGRIFVNGPTGISVETQEMKAEQQEVREEDQVTAGNGEQQTTNTSTSVSGFEGQEGQAGQAGAEGNGARSNNRGVISTDPKKNGPRVKKLPPGFHMDTTDWSRDSGRWAYTGGDWALVTLPDPAHPNIPAPDLPGKALVVVTKDYLKKVRVKRVFRGLTNVTLHYRFFLSQGVAPMGVPELKVYQVAEDKAVLLITETSRGAWSDNTLRPTDTDAFTIVFEGRRMREGNEIVVDDITVSGISPGDMDIPRADIASQPTDSSDSSVQTSASASANQESSPGPQMNTDDNTTQDQTPETLVVDNSTDISKPVTPTDNTENVEVAVSENMHTTQGNVNTEHKLDNATLIEGDESANNSTIDWASETVEVPGPEESTISVQLGNGGTDNISGDGITEASELIQNVSEWINTTEFGDISQDGSDGNLTSVDETFTLSPTGVTGMDLNNQTEGTLETDMNNTTDEINDNSTSPLLPSQPPTLDNISFPDTTNTMNNTLSPTQSQMTDGEVSQEISTTSLGEVTAEGTSGAPEPPFNTDENGNITNSISTYDKPTDLIETSTSPSGTLITPGNATGTDVPMVMLEGSTGSSWRVFQIFLVLCVLGLLALGFLYWRKKRRQDDEIPMFSRDANADYHNPTFSVDDDSSFVSRGGSRHNYKSFE